MSVSVCYFSGFLVLGGAAREGEGFCAWRRLRFVGEPEEERV